MKKFISSFFVLMVLLTPLAHARNIQHKIISAVTISDSPTSASAVVTNINNAKQIGFFVSYDETDSGAAESIAVTIAVSQDGTNYNNITFHDSLATAFTTLVASKTISADNLSYYCWVDPQVVAPYYKITLTATGSDVTHTAVVNAWVTTQDED